MIILWSGSADNIPDGWALCDGNNGTPDLTDKFVIGAGCEYSMRYYKNSGRFRTSPTVGDQIFFKDSSGNIGHTGIVYNVDKSYVYTIEGNTSSASGVIANGGGRVSKEIFIKL